MSTTTTATDANGSAGPPVFGVLTDSQTYKNLLYLFLRFPLGIVYFTVLVTGFAVGTGLAMLLVGFVVLALTVAGATYAGSLEALLANRLLGTDIEYEPHDPTEKSLVEYTKDVLTDARSYLLLVYMFATFPIGTALFSFGVVFLTFSVVTILAPFSYWLPYTEYTILNGGAGSINVPLIGEISGQGSSIVVDTLPEALLLAAVGLVVGFVGLYLINGLARVHGRLTAAVLGQNR